MLSLNNKALIIKLFHKNDESVTDVLRKFRTAKELKKNKGPIFSIRDAKTCQVFQGNGLLGRAVDLH